MTPEAGKRSPERLSQALPQDVEKNLTIQREELAKRSAQIQRLKQQMLELNAAEKKRLLGERKLKDQILALSRQNDGLKKQVQELAEQLNATKEQHDGAPSDAEAEATVYRLSLIILGKCNEETLSEKDIAMVRRVFGENMMKTTEVYNERISALEADCKTLSSVLVEQVLSELFNLYVAWRSYGYSY